VGIDIVEVRWIGRRVARGPDARLKRIGSTPTAVD
jgi:hypothetical protein